MENRTKILYFFIIIPILIIIDFKPIFNTTQYYYDANTE